jgi:UTP-glucose-1-phosphate uridylyltransferase
MMDEFNSNNITYRPPEFQAVFIIDYDDGRLFPLTEDCPKCLLPIANKRLLSYQFDMLAKSGITGLNISKDYGVT